MPGRRVLVTPILHPSAVVQGLWHLESPQVTYLERVASLMARSYDTSQPPPRTILYPKLDQLAPFQALTIERGAVAVDLETAGPHLICAGLTAFTLGDPKAPMDSLCLRFRLQGGVLYWTRGEHELAIQMLGELLAHPKVWKVFHNGVGFDVPYLLDLGFPMVEPWTDTMIMAHACYSEQPKGLQFLSTLHLGYPVWKTLKDPKDVETEAPLGTGDEAA